MVDPGTYLYSADWAERNRFRSTAYHSTVMIDGEEQNVTDEKTPFVIGDEAHPRVLEYEFSEARDIVTAEHDGYGRLAEPVTHRRTVEFDKVDRYWLVTDSFTGEGSHEFKFIFHFAPGLEIAVSDDNLVTARDGRTDVSLLIKPLGLNSPPELEPRFSSRNYGKKDPSIATVWTVNSAAPLSARWAIIPLSAGQDRASRLSAVGDLPHPAANP